MAFSRLLRLLSVFTSIVSACAAAPATPPPEVRLPAIPAHNQAFRADKLLRGQVRYILEVLPAGEIPNPNEHPIRLLSGTAFATAVCLKFADCDAPDAARAAVIRILTDLTRTHVTGGGHTASGQPWGNHWQSAMWAYQAGFAAWLLWPDLPQGLRSGVIAMIVHEADRFANLPPPYAEFLDTKAEENAWNADVLVLAGEMLPSHPHAAQWRERAIEYTISSLATRADRRSNVIVNGKPLRKWVTGANVHSDFTMENHGFVHPDYMTTVAENLMHALVYRLARDPVPEAMFHNAKETYEVLKVFTLKDGSLFYPNGTDWNLHHLDHAWNLHLLAERLLHDPEASALASCALDTLEKMQGRNPSGRLFSPGEYVAYPAPEQHSAFLVASAVAAAKLWPAPPVPARLDAVWKRLHGNRVFEDGKLFVSRSAAGISSFAWGQRVMGQTIPFDYDSILLPLNRSYAGLEGPPPESAEKPGRLGLTSGELDRAMNQDTLSLSGAIVTEEAGAVSVTASGRRAKSRQSFSFTALPDGRSVYMERFDGAAKDCYGGMIALLEDPRWVYGREKRDIQYGKGWVNIDNRLGFVFSSGTEPVERRQFFSHLLFLDAPARTGEIAVILSLPGASVEATRTAASEWVRGSYDGGAVASVSTGGFLVVTSFDGVGHQNPTTVKVQLGSRPVEVPVNGGSTRILRIGKLDR